MASFGGFEYQEFAGGHNLGQESETEASPKAQPRAEAMVQFIKGRREEMLAELEGPLPDWPALPRWNAPALAKTNTPMQVQGSFSAVVAPVFPPDLTNLLNQGVAYLHHSIEGKKVPQFTQFGAMAVAKAAGSDSTLVRVVAATKTGDLRWNLAFVIDPYRMIPGTSQIGPFSVQAPLTQSDPTRRNVQGKYAWNGTLELTQVSTNLGGTISGTFKIRTTAFEEEKKP